MTNQLKVVLEDFILFLLIVIVVAYMYPGGYPDPCQLPSFFNPVGIARPDCTLAAISAPPHLFFITVDLLILIIFAYVLIFLTSLRDKNKDGSIDFNKSSTVIQIFLAVFLILTVLAYIAPKNCNGYYCQSWDAFLGGTSLVALGLTSLILSTISYIIWYFVIRWINKKVNR